MPQASICSFTTYNMGNKGVPNCQYRERKLVAFQYVEKRSKIMTQSSHEFRKCG